MIDDLWYKNGVFYCLSVGTYMDANGDGIGDFKGLLRRLDYLHGLGITTIWLMPFQPSPGKDDGYDVSNYYDVDPRYGTLGDFVEFTHGCRQRGIRVIIDLVALNERGEIWIVEIKSSIEDLRADQKWPEYRAHCDRLFFAFTQDLPCEIFPADTGLIVADSYGAHLHCEAPEHRLAAATRKLMLLRFALAAAQRLNRLADPHGHPE